MLVRNNTTGDVITLDDFRRIHPQTSFPHVISEDILEAFGFSPVMQGQRPTGEPWQSAVPDGIKLVAGKWTETFKLEPATLDAAGLDAQRAIKLAALAAKRWEMETGVIEVGGMPLKLDEATTNKLDAAYMFATRRPGFTAEWKLGNGAFITLDAATIIALGDAAGDHVQACFANEKALTAEIMAANNWAELNAVDIESGW